jgi:hypothetical protein
MGGEQAGGRQARTQSADAAAVPPSRGAACTGERGRARGEGHTRAVLPAPLLGCRICSHGDRCGGHVHDEQGGLPRAQGQRGGVHRQHQRHPALRGHLVPGGGQGARGTGTQGPPGTRWDPGAQGATWYQMGARGPGGQGARGPGGGGASSSIAASSSAARSSGGQDGVRAMEWARHNSFRRQECRRARSCRQGGQHLGQRHWQQQPASTTRHVSSMAAQGASAPAPHPPLAPHPPPPADPHTPLVCRCMPPRPRLLSTASPAR